MHCFSFRLATGKEPPCTSWFLPLSNANDLPPHNDQNVGIEFESSVSSTDVDVDFQTPQCTMRKSADNTEEEILPLVAGIHEFAARLEDMVHSKPSSRKSVSSFLKNASRISTTSAMESALVTFGPYAGVHPKTTGRSKTIGVQPTAISRRTFANGGKRGLSSGRPPKHLLGSEHQYAKSKKQKGLQQILNPQPMQRANAAPHSLAECVSRNISLGK